MNGDPRTGPLALGRWQRPAALVVAGLVPLDPYPMEKILYCATCGQQFFGTHQPNGSTHTPDGTHPTDTTQPTVCGTEECTEQRPPAGSAHPTDYTYRPYEPCDGRVYRTLCTCRPGPLPASEIEIRIYTETHIHAFGPITHTTKPVVRLTSAHYAVLAIRFFTRIELGPTVDNIAFINRI
jgi:hypothetical protein